MKHETPEMKPATPKPATTHQPTDWRKLAKALALVDGHVTEREVTILRQIFLADKAVSKAELDFLHELKKEAKSAVHTLDSFIGECEKKAA